MGYYQLSLKLRAALTVPRESDTDIPLGNITLNITFNIPLG